MGGSKLPKFSLKNLQNAGKKLTYRQSLILAGLFCFGLFGVLYFITGGGAKKDAEAPKKVEPQVEKVSVVVANQDISSRALIRENMIKTVAMPKDTVPVGAVTSADNIIGKPASTNILQGDVLTDRKVLTDPRMAGFKGLIPADCRAVTVPISDITGVAGFLKPGDFVDVMLISKKSRKGDTKSEIILQKVLLLAVNKNANVKEPTGKEQEQKGNDAKRDDKKDKKKEGEGSNVNASPEGMASATMALTPEEALMLATRAQEGTIHLMLRPFKPNETFVLDTEYNLYGEPEQTNATPPASTYQPPPQQAPATFASREVVPAPSPKPEKKKEETVEVIRGTQTATVGVE